MPHGSGVAEWSWEEETVEATATGFQESVSSFQADSSESGEAPLCVFCGHCKD